MSAFTRELEIIVENVERIDRHLEHSIDGQRALYEAGREFYREQLDLANEIVASDEFVQEDLERLVKEVSWIRSGLQDVVDAQQQSTAKISKTIEELGPLFQWGFEHVICQIELQRKDLQAILRDLQAPLDTQAKELRERAFEALGHGWRDEALTDLLASEAKNYLDFTVLHTIAAIYKMNKDFTNAREYYQKAAKYAKPYSRLDAAENHLGASVACRQLEDVNAAYQHTNDAMVLDKDSLVARYEHAMNCICLSTSLTSKDELADQLVEEAMGHLRFVLWADSRYARRISADPYFALVPHRRDALLKDFQKHLNSKAEMCMADIKRRIEEAE